LTNLTDYEKAFRGGGRPGYITSETPLVGGLISDTPIEMARRNMEEVIGRLASGGAINQPEEERFRKMLPRPGDDEKTQIAKLLNTRREYENKLRAFGVSPEDLGELGFDTEDLGQSGQYASAPQRGLIPKDESQRGFD